jgi:mannan endo-1,4-beta-mannosidase
VKTRILAVAAAVSACAMAAACTAAVRTGHAPRAVPAAPAATAFPAHAVGIVTTSLTGFDALCGCAPALAVRYIRWGETVRSAGLGYDLEHGAVPLAELQPYGPTLAQVADGSRDAWLTAFARQVAALRGPVILSFGPEANNDTYPWGWRHSSPAEYVAAWRHVAAVFRRAGARNVRWAWIVNAASIRTGPLPPLWPGPGIVSYIGIDGYATHEYTTFAGLFGETIAEVRRLSAVPVMITETAADPQAGQARWVAQVTAGVRSSGLAGFAWFDTDQADGRDPDAPAGNRHDWSIDGSPAALAAFRAAAKAAGR